MSESVQPIPQPIPQISKKHANFTLQGQHIRSETQALKPLIKTGQKYAEADHHGPGQTKIGQELPVKILEADLVKDDAKWRL